MYSNYFVTPVSYSKPKKTDYSIYIVIFIVVVIISLLIYLYFKFVRKEKKISQEVIDEKCKELMKDHITITPEDQVMWYYENCNGNIGQKCKELALKSKLNSLTGVEQQEFSDCERPIP